MNTANKELDELRADIHSALTQDIYESKYKYSNLGLSIEAAVGRAEKEATQSITQLLEELLDRVEEDLPKDRIVTNEKTYEGYDRTNPRHRYTTGVDVGFNQAVATQRKSLQNIREEL